MKRETKNTRCDGFTCGGDVLKKATPFFFIIVIITLSSYPYHHLRRPSFVLAEERIKE